jgi:hypothetical protein
LTWRFAVIVMEVISGLIVVALAWAGWRGCRRRGRGAGPSVAEKFRRQREIDQQRIAEKGLFEVNRDGVAARSR